jgi:hypothetical protein
MPAEFMINNYFGIPLIMRPTLIAMKVLNGETRTLKYLHISHMRIEAA